VNWKEYLRGFKRDPFAFPYYVAGGRESLRARAFSNSLGRNLRDLRQEFSTIPDSLQTVFDEVANLPYLGWTNASEVLYVATRALKPSNIVETGVAAGLSSACILAALEKNGQGRLYSIDLPNVPSRSRYYTVRATARRKGSGILDPRCAQTKMEPSNRRYSPNAAQPSSQSGERGHVSARQ
jgi:hypothetical protein